MNRAIAGLLFGLLFGASSLLAEGDARRLQGVWRFQGEVDTLADGSPAPPGSAAADCDGVLIYSADGFMSVNIMPKGRHWDTETATIAELRETISNGTGYAGRFEVDESAHTVTHIPFVSMEPGYEQKRLLRSYAFKGDDLELSGTFEYQGKTIRFTLTWARMDSKVPPIAKAEEIQRQVRERLDAYERRDATAWARYIDDGCLCGGDTKENLRKAILDRPAAVKNGYGAISNFTLREQGPVAMAHYRVTEFTEIGGHRLETDLVRTETYARRDGLWKLIGGADVAIPHDPEIAKVDPQLYDAYVGQYEYAPGVRDTVTREGDRLLIQSTGQGQEEIFPENDSTFFGRRQAWRMIFVKDDTGRVASLHFRQDGQDLVARRVP